MTKRMRLPGMLGKRSLTLAARRSRGLLPLSRRIHFTLLALLLTTPLRAQPADFPTRIDAAAHAAIERGDVPGAVILVGKGEAILHRKAYGLRMIQPEARPMTVDILFDLASLTKPVATATSIMVLADRGVIDVREPVAKYLPEFGRNGKESITVEQLLLHRGGLIADNHLRDYADGPWQAMLNIFALPTQSPPGTAYTYTDVGYIVLAEVVRRVDGRAIDLFARDEVFLPLGMREAMFNPPPAWKERSAPTARRGGRWMIGEVHDPRAFALGGVAGHAGLFGTVDDLARFCRMILNLGRLDGVRLLSEETARRMLERHCLPDGGGCRSYLFGFGGQQDSARGDVFTPGETFGHTGFTGTMFWIDPEHEGYVIVLANRVHPEDEGRVAQLRREVATAAAQWLRE